MGGALIFEGEFIKFYVSKRLEFCDEARLIHQLSPDLSKHH